jgi:hypothetical protein
MNFKKAKVTCLFILISMFLAGLLLINGCKKEEPAAPPKPAPPVNQPK